MVDSLNRFGGNVPTSLLAIAIVIGHASHAEAARTVEVTVEPNKGAGVGFGQILEEPQTLTIRVTAPGEWFIRWSKRRRNRGIELWTPEQNNTRAKTHTYIVEGVIPDEGHAAAFEGELTKEGGGGDPPDFDAAVADLDMDGDVLHTHRGPHWPPLDSGDSQSALEDSREYDPGEGGGYLLPRLLPAGEGLPANAEGKDYKIIRVRIRPEWGGDSSRESIGDLFFAVPFRTELYDIEKLGKPRLPRLAGRFTEFISIPPGEFIRNYGILTEFDSDFSVDDTLTAWFTWDKDIRGSQVWFAAREDIRVRSVDLKLSIASSGHELGNGLEGEIGEQGSPVDDDKKVSVGAYLLVNWDDDDGTGQMNPDGSWAQLPVPDLEKSGHVENEDNLAKLTMHLSPHSNIGKIELEVIQGVYNIKLWTHSTKGEEIVLTDGKKTWDLAIPAEETDFMERCENGIWIEGVKRSIAERDVEIVLRYKLGEPVLSDTVKATVVMINLANAVYRDNQMEIQTDRGHSALVAYFDGAPPGESFRTALENDSHFRIIEMDGPTGHRSLDTITGPTQYGCFTNVLGPPWGEGIDYVARLRILAAAKALVARADTIEYTASNAVRPADWNGRLNTITHLRCDGLVEVCYEMNGVDVWAKLRIPDNNTYHFDITAPGDAWTYNGVQTWVAGANNIRDNLEEHNEFLELMWEFTLMPATQCRHVAPEGAMTTFTMQDLCQPVGTRGGNP